MSRSNEDRLKVKPNELKGIRDITLYAYVRAGVGKNRQSTADSILLENVCPDTIKNDIQNYENMLTKRYSRLWDYDEDEIYVDIKDSLGWTGSIADGICREDGYSLENNPYSISNF